MVQCLIFHVYLVFRKTIEHRRAGQVFGGNGRRDRPIDFCGASNTISCRNPLPRRLSFQPGSSVGRRWCILKPARLKRTHILLKPRLFCSSPFIFVKVLTTNVLNCKVIHHAMYSNLINAMK